MSVPADNETLSRVLDALAQAEAENDIEEVERLVALLALMRRLRRD